MRLAFGLLSLRCLLWVGWFLDMLALMCLLLLESMGLTEEMRRDYMG
jgi:hypothetical protein